jgi:hypothetical protein
VLEIICYTILSSHYEIFSPSAKEENEYIEGHSFEEYGKWYLGIDTDEKEDAKGR